MSRCKTANVGTSFEMFPLFCFAGILKGNWVL